eukprot:SAG11_NODE_8845_length_970_cov_1.361653_1_plen_27_part_10
MIDKSFSCCTYFHYLVLATLVVATLYI